MNQNLVITVAPRSILFTLALLIGITLLTRIPEIIAILLVSLILAAAMIPGVAYFERRLRLKRPLAILLVFLMILGSFGLIGLMILPVLIDQAFQLIHNLPSYATLGRSYLARAQGLGIHLPETSTLVQLASRQATGWLQSTLSYTFQAVGVMLNLFGVFLTVFFLLLDGPRLRAGTLRLVPPAYREKIEGLVEPVALQLGAYVRGQLAVISLFTLYLAITLSIARVPYALVLALVAGILDIIPMVGILGVIPAALLALTVSWKLALVVVGIFMLGNFLEGNVLSPLILSKSVNIPPIFIFFALMIGSSFMGIVGALIAVPVTAALLVIIKRLYLPAIEAEP